MPMNQHEWKQLVERTNRRLRAEQAERERAEQDARAELARRRAAFDAAEDQRRAAKRAEIEAARQATIAAAVEGTRVAVRRSLEAQGVGGADLERLTEAALEAHRLEEAKAAATAADDLRNYFRAKWRRGA